MEEGVKKYRVTLFIEGIKKRCRKAKQHRIFLGYADYNGGDADASKFKERAFEVVDKQFKVFTSAGLEFLLVSVRGNVETWSPFDDDYEQDHLFINNYLTDQFIKHNQPSKWASA